MVLQVSVCMNFFFRSSAEVSVEVACATSHDPSIVSPVIAIGIQWQLLVKLSKLT